MKHVEIYTNGSCLNNPGFGGYAYIVRYKEHEKVGVGAEENTTNDGMELKAIIKALEILKEPCEVYLYTDSNLMVQSINEWLEDWAKKNFKGRKNADLWRECLRISKEHKIRAIWIKAHNGHKENERCDTLAKETALQLQGKHKGAQWLSSNS